MKKLIILLLCHTASAVTHSLMNFVTGSSGLQNFSEFVAVLAVDGVDMLYCDSSSYILEQRQEWVKEVFENSTDQKQSYIHLCFEDQPVFFTTMIQNLMQYFSQSGAHTLQRTGGCEWDEITGEVTGMVQFGYDGEGFAAFDMKTLTWIALKPEAAPFQHIWNNDKPSIQLTEDILTKTCPEQLKIYWSFGKSFLQRKVLPSVSLLQKTPSSPVTCHATGFYPSKATAFWKKDGEEIHEGVSPGEILRNDDETFQISVDLNVSSVTPGDWGRYDCVFQLSGVEDVVTKLDKTVIRTNWVKNIHTELPIIIAVCILVLIIGAIGFIVYKKKKERRLASSPGIMAALAERPRTGTQDSDF